MRHLQIYEDSIVYGMSPEDTERAYLGEIKTPATPNPNTGSPSRLTFSDIQMSTREVEAGGETYQELMILTEGSMIDLQPFEYEDIEGKTIKT